MGKNCKTLIEKLQEEKGIDWNSLDTHLQRGSCCIKEVRFYLTKGDTTVYRQKWVIDMDTHIFSDDPGYVNQRIIF